MTFLKVALAVLILSLNVTVAFGADDNLTEVGPSDPTGVDTYLVSTTTRSGATTSYSEAKPCTETAAPGQGYDALDKSDAAAAARASTIGK